MLAEYSDAIILAIWALSYLWTVTFFYEKFIDEPNPVENKIVATILALLWPILFVLGIIRAILGYK
jgi:hypothetical protein